MSARLFLVLLLTLVPPWADAKAEPFCAGECAVHVFTGTWVNDSMIDIFVHEGIPPWNWQRRERERITGLALSRRVGALFGVVDVEPEIGVAHRGGAVDAQELWAAIYFRYDRFPWNDTLYTSVGISTGINYATRVTELERRRARGSPDGSRHTCSSPETGASVLVKSRVAR